MSHLALVIMGHPAGKVYAGSSSLANSRGESTVENRGLTLHPIHTGNPEGALRSHSLELGGEEGLALNNGTQMMTAIES